MVFYPHLKYPSGDYADLISLRDIAVKTELP